MTLPLIARTAATLVVATALTLSFPAPANAQDPDAMIEQVAEQTALEMRAEQIVAMMNGELDMPVEQVFTESSLAAVPKSQLEEISAQLTGQFGPALSVESLDTPAGNRSALSIRMESAIARGGIAIDPANGNRISELLFQNFEPIDDSPEKIEDDLSALPGTTNARFGRIGEGGVMEPVLAHNANQPLALGSAFELYVLSALAGSIE